MASIALPPRLVSLAARQHGVLSGSDLLSAGLTRRQIRSRLERGSLVGCFGDTFRVAGAPYSTSARYLAAALAVPGSVISGRAAAHLHRFPASPKVSPEVLTHHRGGHRVVGVRVHRSWSLPDRHLAKLDGVPVTTVPRTVLDLAAVLSAEDLERLIDGLVADRRLRLRHLFDEFDHLASKGRPGTAVLRELLVPRLCESVVPLTELERRGTAFLREFRIDIPSTQFCPPWAGRAVARVDMADVERRVVIEFDGRRWHDTDRGFENDRVRDQLAMAHGWIVVRITWRQLTRDAPATADRLGRILEARTQGRS